MVHINVLKGKMVERSVTAVDLANAMGVNNSTYYRRMRNDGNNLRVKDINAIKETLNLSADEFCAIFY